jgi:hypothetical protein
MNGDPTDRDPEARERNRADGKCMDTDERPPELVGSTVSIGGR